MSDFELLKTGCEGKGEDDYVFTREDGKQVQDFRESWANATTPAGVAEVHDLRRTRARNMRRRGIGRDVITKIGGWKTDSMFRRPTISSANPTCTKPPRPLNRKSQLSHNSATEGKRPEIPSTQDATIQ